MKYSSRSAPLTRVVTCFLGEAARLDAGHTLALLHAGKLTGTQLAALEFVFEPRTISAVASYLGLSRPAASQMIHKLVRRGLVKRFEGAVDRRAKNVVLSARGSALIEKVASARAARFAASISELSPQAARRLKGALRDAAIQLEKARMTAKKRTK